MLIDRPDRQKEMSRVINGAESRLDVTANVRRLAQKPLGSGRRIGNLQSGVAFRAFDLPKADTLSKISAGGLAQNTP